jgi:murein DD-endopeptidase MepM/ murein hydrolase activator NlpD
MDLLPAAATGILMGLVLGTFVVLVAYKVAPPDAAMQDVPGLGGVEASERASNQAGPDSATAQFTFGIEAAPAPAGPPFGTGGLPGSGQPGSAPPEPPGEARRFAWPAEGRLTSRFSAKHPLGIDIGILTGGEVHASAAGTVVFTGGRACCLYGLYVDIDHGDGYITRYAHLSKIQVETSQPVQQGQVIALSGNTGFSTGPHLHFEILHEGIVQDPLQFLGER